MRRVLIANRGEIALRAVRACRQLSLESLAVYSSADANSLHRCAADHAICIGPPAPRTLARFQVAGLTTTIPFHSHLLQRPEYMRAEVDTRRVEESMQGSAH